jgi:hypothetical protein
MNAKRNVSARKLKKDLQVASDDGKYKNKKIITRN